MQAIIFASGSGTRLFPQTLVIPKCLLAVNNKIILGSILESLQKNNITDIVITTGPHAPLIKKYVKEHFPDLKITYVHNKIYAQTNYIYSLWKARNRLSGDIITIHGDLIYDHSLMKRVVTSKKSCVLVNTEVPLPEKDFKARVKKGFITEIGVNVFGSGAAFCLPLYKFLKKDWDIFISQVDLYIKRNDLKVYAENAFNDVSDKIKLTPLYFTKPAMEVDTAVDLRIAQDTFI